MPTSKRNQKVNQAVNQIKKEIKERQKAEAADAAKSSADASMSSADASMSRAYTTGELLIVFMGASVGNLLAAAGNLLAAAASYTSMGSSDDSDSDDEHFSARLPEAHADTGNVSQDQTEEIKKKLADVFAVYAAEMEKALKEYFLAIQQDSNVLLEDAKLAKAQKDTGTPTSAPPNSPMTDALPSPGYVGSLTDISPTPPNTPTEISPSMGVSFDGLPDSGETSSSVMSYSRGSTPAEEVVLSEAVKNELSYLLNLYQRVLKFSIHSQFNRHLAKVDINKALDSLNKNEKLSLDDKERIERSPLGKVLQAAGNEKDSIFFPKTLTDIMESWLKTPQGQSIQATRDAHAKGAEERGAAEKKQKEALAARLAEKKRMELKDKAELSNLEKLEQGQRQKMQDDSSVFAQSIMEPERALREHTKQDETTKQKNKTAALKKIKVSMRALESNEKELRQGINDAESFEFQDLMNKAALDKGALPKNVLPKGQGRRGKGAKAEATAEKVATKIATAPSTASADLSRPSAASTGGDESQAAVNLHVSKEVSSDFDIDEGVDLSAHTGPKTNRPETHDFSDGPISAADEARPVDGPAVVPGSASLHGIVSDVSHDGPPVVPGDGGLDRPLTDSGFLNGPKYGPAAAVPARGNLGDPTTEDEISDNIISAMKDAIEAAKSSWGYDFGGKVKILSESMALYQATHEPAVKDKALETFIFKAIEARNTLGLFIGKKADGHTKSATVFLGALNPAANRKISSLLATIVQKPPLHSLNESTFAKLAIDAKAERLREQTPPESTPGT